MSRDMQKRQASSTVPGRPVSPVSPLPPTPRVLPGEPSEVLGRHKNSGQRDHKGAR
jgi:hypothetical protein